MKRFEIAKHYTWEGRPHDKTYIVIERTDTHVTLMEKQFNGYKLKPIKSRISVRNECEVTFPNGYLSMSPLISAEEGTTI